MRSCAACTSSLAAQQQTAQTCAGKSPGVEQQGLRRCRLGPPLGLGSASLCCTTAAGASRGRCQSVEVCSHFSDSPEVQLRVLHRPVLCWGTVALHVDSEMLYVALHMPRFVLGAHSAAFVFEWVAASWGAQLGARSNCIAHALHHCCMPTTPHIACTELLLLAGLLRVGPRSGCVCLVLVRP